MQEAKLFALAAQGVCLKSLLRSDDERKVTILAVTFNVLRVAINVE
jgi:hypothetical protein